MFSVVGCSNCDELWVVEGRPDTTRCRRCGTRRQFSKLKKFAETDTAEAAKNVRSVMKQRQAGDDSDLDDFVTMGEEAADAGIDDADYLDAVGVDSAAVAEAGTVESGRSLSKREAVETALDELDRPTTDAIAEFAAEHGASRDYVERALDKLERAGEITASGGEYRRL
ncbi:DUF5817 domain-containing protein [Halosegnis longus]|uniref:Replication protein H n=1 Tax=Halosegnis longus TaxID=2216012 RepID=A0AAJ4UVG9_9EURY|nr:DUF5817 domain-containing protein [Halosegnis longus]RNJ25940.1 replication protein H [Salella cibi]